jgi:hypothetical protein
MESDPILSAILSAFIESAKRGSFNGLVAATLLRFVDSADHLRAHLTTLADEQKITCVFSSTNVNIHIKRFHDLPIERQRELLKMEAFNEFCVYPTASEISKKIDVTQWNDRPFSKALVLAEPQLDYRAFEMGALERYVADPRYIVRFFDYMGSMSVSDKSFSDSQHLERDKVSLQTFGLGFDDQRNPYAVVYLRYLADLSVEHQQYWNSYLTHEKVRMCEQYYQSSILGKFWENRSVRFAIVEEMKLINAMFKSIWGATLFREIANGDLAIGLTAFLRPTADNFHSFVMALDKLLSESIDVKFFKDRVTVEREVDRPDGKIEIQRKGSLALLEEWLCAEIIWDNVDEFRKVVIAPMREVRRLRQEPAHTFTTDDFSKDYYASRRKHLWAVFNSLNNIRATLNNHPNVRDIKVPPWLNDEKIDVF